MKYKRESVLLVALACVLAFGASLYAEQRGSLSAYTIHYDSNTEQIEASGNVVLTKGQSIVSGDKGTGKVTSRVFEITGNVSGVFPEYGAELKSAESLKWTEGTGGSGGQIEVRGGVSLTRGKNDYMKANYVMWTPDTDNYFARGGVNTRFNGHILKAAEARRTGNTFYAVDVKRYENIAQRTGMSADRVDGRMVRDDVQEIVAVGNVKIDHTDEEKVKTVVTGAKAVYTKELDTVVVSGGAKAVRSDGNTVSSEKMVMHIGTNRIEAVGKASLSFKAEDNKNKKQKNGASD